MKIRSYNCLIVSISYASLLCSFTTISYAKDESPSTLKRLFYSESERYRIDKARNSVPIKSVETGKKTRYSNSKNTAKLDTKPGKSRVPIQDTVVIDGYIQREDGKNVVWFNNTNTLDLNSRSMKFKVESKGIDGQGIDVISKNKKRQLKPGQVLEISSGKVSESFNIKDAEAKVEIEEQ